MADLDDVLTDGQDAFFAGQWKEAAARAREALALSATERDAHRLLVEALKCGGEYEAAVDAACEWASEAGSTSLQVALLAEAAFMCSPASVVVLKQCIDSMTTVEVSDVV
jgi:hypothetical protein